MHYISTTYLWRKTFAIQEPQLNQMEVEMDDDLRVSIIAKRQPTAGDLRAVVSVMKVITDLERIGDEAHRVAKMALLVAGNDMPDDQYANFRSLHTNVVQHAQPDAGRIRPLGRGNCTARDTPG